MVLLITTHIDSYDFCQEDDICWRSAKQLKLIRRISFHCLKGQGLTTTGIEDVTSFRICQKDGKTAGCFGIVHSGDGAMLRSFAVEPEMQGTGIGSFMAVQSMKYAIENEIMPMYLLTNTADKFFANSDSLKSHGRTSRRYSWIQLLLVNTVPAAAYA